MSTGREWHSWAGVSVGVHLHRRVELASTVYVEENRAVIKVRGENFADLSLFADLADLDRLVDTVTAARDQLAAGLAAIESAATDGMDPAAADAA